MEELKNKKVSNLYVLILAIFMCFSVMFSSTTLLANAAEPETKTQAQTIMDNIKFITFKKGLNDSRGKFMIACYYIPNTALDPSCSYNMLIVPRAYFDKLNIKENYLEQLEANNLQKIIVPLGDFADLQTIDEGKSIRLGLANILDKNASLEFAFTLYVDDPTGARAYYEPVYATYNTLDSKDYTNAEMEEITRRKLTMDSSFESIVKKIQELVNSVWKYIVIGLASVVIVWGAYVGIRIAVAKKNDEKINARGMVKSLIVGIVIMFVLAMGTPLLINGLSVWIK